jgi:hypothetical protein
MAVQSFAILELDEHGVALGGGEGAWDLVSHVVVKFRNAEWFECTMIGWCRVINVY